MLSYSKENKEFAHKTGVACVFTSSHNKSYSGYNQLLKTFAETLDQ